jgi:AraC-like DNA-binding protein
MNPSLATLPAPSTYTRMLLQRLPGQAVTLLEGTGLSAAAIAGSATITLHQQLQIFRNAMALANRADWALAFGQQLNINSHGPLGFGALSAPTLRDGLDMLGHFARIRAPYLGFSTYDAGNRVILELHSDVWPMGDLELPLVEIVLQVANSYIEAVLGHSMTEASLMIAAPRPAHAALYSDYFASPCEFDAPMHAYTLPANLGQLPCPLYDEKTWRAALVSCREALDCLLSRNDLATRVRHLLASHFDRIGISGKRCELPRLSDLASTLCVSPRSLIRQLAAQDTSFRELLEAEQLAVACKLLAQARYSVSEIGSLLGFSDAANFGRAFRRLTGMAPGLYRRTGKP